MPAPVADNPLGLPTYTPVYPGAVAGLVSPYSDGLRTFKGDEPVTARIDRAIEHHCATTVDQLALFSRVNDRDVCPNWYIRTDGTVYELIRPGRKPATTGPEWNYRSLSWELLNATGAPGWEGTPAQFEAVCQLLAWIASHDGKLLDGAPVTFKLTREFFINHQEALPGTECPGPWWVARMDKQLERARVIYAERYAA